MEAVTSWWERSSWLLSGVAATKSSRAMV